MGSVQDTYTGRWLTLLDVIDPSTLFTTNVRAHVIANEMRLCSN
jgi:hypothetical protein